jgi:lipid-A-disaccharide synthase-like uncharacterized protein
MNHIQLTENKMKETILSTNSDEDDEEEDDEFKSSILAEELDHPRQQQNRVLNRPRVLKQLFILFLLFVTVGCLFINFLLFMNNYLVSRLTVEFFYQAELIDKLFYASLIAGHLLVLFFLAIGERVRFRQRRIAQQQQQQQPKHRLHRVFKNVVCGSGRNLAVVLVFLTMLIVSFTQLTAEHFSKNDLELLILNLKHMTNSGSNSSRSNTDNTAASKVKFNDMTILLFGSVYPMLVSALVPLLTSMIDTNRRIFLVIKSRSNLALILWFCVMLGCVMQCVINNYFIYYIFRTQNVFIYANILASFSLTFLILVYFCLN